jgi:hypothetical protein
LRVIFPINYGIVTGDARMKAPGRLFLILIHPNIVETGLPEEPNFTPLAKGEMVNPLDFPFQ